MGRGPARSGFTSDHRAPALVLGLALLACGQASRTAGDGSADRLGTGGTGTSTTGGSVAVGTNASSGGAGGQAGATPGSLQLCECTFETREPAAEGPFFFEATLDGQPVSTSAAEAWTLRFGGHVEAFGVQFVIDNEVRGHVQVSALSCDAEGILLPGGQLGFYDATGWLQVATTTADWLHGISTGTLHAEFSTLDGLAGPVLDARFVVPASLQDSWMR